MHKPKLLVYSNGCSSCLRAQAIFSNEFDADIIETSDEFKSKVRTGSADAAVLCFCSASGDDAEDLKRLQSIAVPLPMIACSRAYTLDFVREAAQGGANYFICCDGDRSKTNSTIYDAMQREGIKKFLRHYYLDNLNSSPHSRKIINAIIRAFPMRMSECELARDLGMSDRWLRNLCRRSFRGTFSQLVRRIWVHQALNMMRHTSLDNVEIAMNLKYSEVSSMSRDFRKELGCGCNEARKQLTSRTPMELFSQKSFSALKTFFPILLPFWSGNFPFGFDDLFGSVISFLS